MSASDKKKLRKEQETAMLTQKQREEQAEAKKLKVYTFVFAAVMIIALCVTVVSLVTNTIKQSGVIERNTVAAVVNGTELNAAELAYYYNDAINEMYSSVYESLDSSYVDLYIEAMGLDTTTPLDEQEHPDGGGTWADYFVDAALESAKSDYAMYNLAQEEGFTLSEEEQSTLDIQLSNIENYATLYGYTNAKKYLQAMYGYGADLDSYGKYLERSTIASAFYESYYESLEYDDDAIREYEKDHVSDYNTYNYTYSYLSYNDFIEGGTESDTGTVTYSDEEKDAARAKLKEAAEKLAAATSVEEMETLIDEIEVNEDSELAINAETNQLHTSLDSDLAQWLGDEERTEGDIGMIANATSGDDSVINGYYVVCFQSKNDNTKPMSNVRHLLVQFEGGTTDDSTGETTYSDEEKATASTRAQELMEEWEAGEKTEERFIEMVMEYSDDSSASEGGLFEDINPDSQYVANFLNWSIDPTRTAGDYELIETEYGYHLMYYVGDSELSYRDYMITEELKAADVEEWYNGVVEATTAEKKDLSKLNLGLVLSSSY